MTSKELDKILGVSASAVSFALNGKSGVSSETRNKILTAAAKYGMNVRRPQTTSKNIAYMLFYRKHGAVLTDSSFFSELTEGVEQRCAVSGWSVNSMNIYSQKELEIKIQECSNMRAGGLIILGTEMMQEDFNILPFSEVPVLLLDNHFISSSIDSVQINNVEGAFTAVNYLINRKKVQPGYLHSSYIINNFTQREEGYRRALRYNGMSPATAVIHELTPSIDGAHADMLALLEQGEQPVRTYFADNDQIAIGAMMAFQDKGYKIPDDISIIGFDDIPMCSYTTPPLSTVHVPKQYMGIAAADRLIANAQGKAHYSENIEISTNLVLRKSI
jgi:LacI family transcriptional regulator